MRLNKAGIDLMHDFEGCRLEAYLCPASVPTIGYGSTYYEDGRPVKLGDAITQERADQLFQAIAEDFAKRVRSLLKVGLNENQSAFINRCMGDATMNVEFPKMNQRLAVCLNEWKKKDEAK